METYIARRAMADKEGKADAQPFHLVLLAKNWTGYLNLCRLITDAHIDGYYYKPRIDREHLARYSEGLIGLSACLNGEVRGRSKSRTGSSPASWPANTATSSARTGSSSSSRTTACPSSAGSTSSSSGSPRMAAARRDERPALRAARAVRGARRAAVRWDGNNLDTPNRMRFESAEFYVKSAAEMAALFPTIRRRLRTRVGSPR